VIFENLVAFGRHSANLHRSRSPFSCASRTSIRLINAVIENLKKHYVDPDAARKTADALLAHEKNGDDDRVTDGEAFANLLTNQIRDASHDMHLEVVSATT